MLLQYECHFIFCLVLVVNFDGHFEYLDSLVTGPKSRYPMAKQHFINRRSDSSYYRGGRG